MRKEYKEKSIFPPIVSYNSSMFPTIRSTYYPFSNESVHQKLKPQFNPSTDEILEKRGKTDGIE